MNTDQVEAADATAKPRVDWRQFSVKGLLLLMLVATAFFAGLRRRMWLETEEQTYQVDQRPRLTKDFMLNNLSFKVADVCRRRFGNWRVWSIETVTTAKGEQYEITFFDDRSATSHGGVENGKSFSRLASAKLVINNDGTVVSETTHPIEPGNAPKAVQRAAAKWLESVKGKSTFVEWYVSQKKGERRMYRVRVVHNSISADRATFDGEGKLLGNK